MIVPQHATHDKQSRPPNDFLAAALGYRRRGWSVIPVHGKKARFGWKRFQQKPPDEQLLTDWFSGRFDDITGVAVLCEAARAKVSGAGARPAQTGCLLAAVALRCGRPDEALARLPGRKVAVAGLSMGALLALVLAARHPNRVAGVAALAPAVRFRDRTLNSLRALRVAAPLLEMLRPWVRKETTDLLDDAARAEAPVLRVWPTARLRDLWETQELAWGSAARVICPVLVVVAGQDHVVDEAGAAALVRRLEKSPSVRYVRIEESAHILPRDRNRELVAAEVTGFVERTLGPAAVR